MKKALLLFVICHLSFVISYSTMFINLDFEESLAIIGGHNDADTVPGWVASMGGFWHNNGDKNSGSCSLFDTDLNIFPYFVGKTPLQGDFTAFINAGQKHIGGLADIWQIATLPTGVNSLQFVSEFYGDFEVYYGALGSNPPPLALVDLGPNPYNPGFGRLYGADISNVSMNYGGQNGAILFEVTTTVDYSYAFIDAIQFSTGSIPEPETYALVFGSAALLFAIRYRRRRNTL